MKASIIIITKNQKKYLEKTIPVLLNQNITDYEMIVVDSGSRDGALEYVRSFMVDANPVSSLAPTPRRGGVVTPSGTGTSASPTKSRTMKLLEIEEENFNYSRAFNIAVAKAKGDILIRLSGDAIPKKKDFVAEMIKPFTDDKVGGVYGKYVLSGKKGYGYPDFWFKERFPNHTVRHSFQPLPWSGINIFGLSLDSKKYGDIFTFAGACCAIRRNVWEKRHFNESLLGGEDAEYSWFLHVVGYDVVYVPKAEVLHEHKITKRDIPFLNIWQWKFNWQIMKYWLLRLLNKDPYKDIRIRS